MPTAETIQIVTDVRRTLAGKALTEHQAKLYSQSLRRSMGQEGLRTFSQRDIPVYLDEAILLLQCAFLEQGAVPSGLWQEGVKRAAEILEWLSQSDLRPAGFPIQFLSAAAYQVAGYPAMALAQIQHMPDEPFSKLLREFLQGNFPVALEAIHGFWRDQRVFEEDGLISASDLSVHAIRHTVMCLGTVLAYFRTGVYGKVERALRKLGRIAAGFLHSRDPFSYLLAQLTAAACRRYIEMCLWVHITELRGISTPQAVDALVQYARVAFFNRRILIWPAQATGIARLRENTSFVLCTPTGSGKTTVATLAVVQGLYASPNQNISGVDTPGSLVLYLVPSRALAAEVEARLNQDLRGISAEPVVVTGLYGGLDWGPTDAWVQSELPTILVCTFEKADALLRYLGVLFLSRVRLVLVDEVHMVEQGVEPLDTSARPYRLEQLGTRLLRAQDTYGFRLIALSAVAGQAAPALARWIDGHEDALPTTSDYRSTRQMLGRLIVEANGRFTIHYDLMDGSSLKFSDEQPNESPYVPTPFPPMPGGIAPNAGPEVAMRAPTLWAALHLAAERSDGARPSVLISVTQNIEAFAATCADKLDSWQSLQLPRYRAVNEMDERWIRCLASAADYFSRESVEYRLLERGIAIHHGKIPGLLARRLKILIDCGYVRVIIATSTLSEGVNLPVNYLLIPSVCRGQACMKLQEFRNLIGRAGRPGFASEGHALVVLPQRTYARDKYGRRHIRQSRQWDGFANLKSELEATTTADARATIDESSSPLWHLLTALKRAWSDLTGGHSEQDFTYWLENTVVTDGLQSAPDAIRYLDSLDDFLLAAIQEVEELQGRELMPSEIEAELIRIWKHTYSFASMREEEQMRRIWLDRGRTIMDHYPEAAQRRRIYKTSLSPRSAAALLDNLATIKEKILEGTGYTDFTHEERFIFVKEVLALLSQVPSFHISTQLGRRRDFREWTTLLRWWLAKGTLPQQPEPGEITRWFEFVAQNFIYRGTWGLGSLVGLLLDLADGDTPVRPLEIADWPRSGLPWIAFWLKELITWGTLEPVAAFLLARGNAMDRQEAEAEARIYYEELPAGLDPNEKLNPQRIRAFVEERRPRQQGADRVSEVSIRIRLEKGRNAYINPKMSVVPIEIENRLIWIDPAGYTVARSPKPADWIEKPSQYSFELNVRNGVVLGTAYLPYARS